MEPTPPPHLPHPLEGVRGAHPHHLVNIPDAQQVAVLLQAVALGFEPRLLLAGEEVALPLVLPPALLTLGLGCTHKTPHAVNQ